MSCYVDIKLIGMALMEYIFVDKVPNSNENLVKESPYKITKSNAFNQGTIEKTSAIFLNWYWHVGNKMVV